MVIIYSCQPYGKTIAVFSWSVSRSYIIEGDTSDCEVALAGLVASTVLVLISLRYLR